MTILMQLGVMISMLTLEPPVFVCLCVSDSVSIGADPNNDSRSVSACQIGPFTVGVFSNALGSRIRSHSPYGRTRSASYANPVGNTQDPVHAQELTRQSWTPTTS
jgi:hypothetical protein